MKSQRFPHPDFVRSLEAQLEMRLRNEKRFGKPQRRKNMFGLQSLSLAVVSACLGAAGITAAQEIGDDAHKELFMERAAILVELEQVRVKHLEQIREERVRLMEAGVASSREVHAPTAQLHQAKRQLRVAKLNYEEIELSGKEPQHHLTAPLVEGRDFYRERLLVEYEGIKEEANSTQALIEEVRQRIELGMMPSDAMYALEKDAKYKRFQTELIQRNLDLRDRFLSGKVSKEEVLLQTMLADNQVQLEFAKAQLIEQQQILELVEQQVQSGVAPNRELWQRKLAVREAETQIRLIELEARLLKERQKKE